MVELEVIEGGMFTTVQDSGRPGYRKYGVPVSGAMDGLSYRRANQLVGNPEHYPVLELTLKGGEYRFGEAAIIALTGAAMPLFLNGQKVHPNKAIEVRGGDVLKVGYAAEGCRAYLSVQGKLEIHPVMGSYSTYPTGKFGGYEGRSLKAGDVLRWMAEKRVEYERVLKPVVLQDIHRVQVVPGPEWDWLSEETQECFLSLEFIVSSQSNRMGICLERTPLEIGRRQMKSSPVLPGIIQLPPGGEPIILMQDGQTVGGYPRIAKVLDNELWKVAQLKPGDQLRFKADR